MLSTSFQDHNLPGSHTKPILDLAPHSYYSRQSVEEERRCRKKEYSKVSLLYCL